MRKIRSIIIVVALAAIGLLAAAISPLTVLWVSIAMLTFLSVMRQVNFQRILLALKNYAKNVARMRVEIRAKLHTGFRDYANQLDGEASHRSGRCSYAR
jgi:hypothetical protein